MECCGCSLAGKKFLDENGNIIKEKIAVHFERWYNEMISYNIEQQKAFNMIDAYAKAQCTCFCHYILPKE